MEEALRFFRTYEIWIYLLLILGALVYIRKFFLAWSEMRGAAFGLERESAQSRLNQSASMVVLLLIVGIAEFVLVSFIAPSYPGSNPLTTPTFDLLATATNTLMVTPSGISGTQEIAENILPSPTPVEVGGEGCVPGQVILTAPQPGEEVSGIITIEGTANIPNFGFYKYEIARPGETIWLTILAGRETVQEGELGQWDTATLSPGDYMLRLVVTDNQGESLPPCVIQVRVNNPVEP